MNCQDILKQLDRYRGSELTVQERDEVRIHLESCHACAAEYGFESRVIGMIPELAKEYGPPPEFHGKVMSSFNSSKKRKLAVFLISGAAVLIISVTLWILVRQSDVQVLSGEVIIRENHILARTAATIQLPDTSKIVLRPQAELKYRSRRRVEFVNGEAVFHVTRGGSFEVNTDQASIQVLGTSFELELQSRKLTIHVIDGKVGVETGFRSEVLGPGDVAVCIDGRISLPSAHQDNKQQRVSQKDIDAAIDKGAQWLIQEYDKFLKDPDSKNWSGQGPDMLCELALYTMIHAKASTTNSVFKFLFEKTLSVKPAAKRTYNLAVEAMALSSYNPSKYQERLEEIAQALVDRQCKNGQWSYTGNTEKTKDLYTGKKNTELYTHDRDKSNLKKIHVQRKDWGIDTGDNSNSQYAALGLRACYEAGIEVEPQVLKLAKEWWEKDQNSDGGWEYKSEWKQKGQNSTATMTAGGLGSLASYKRMLKEELKDDKYVAAAVNWLATKFRVDANFDSKGSKHPEWQYYYLYGLERAGVLAGVVKFGNHEWYWDGAEYLIKNQRNDGSWKAAKAGLHTSQKYQDLVNSMLDTCFAILFLKRATEYLIETPHSQKKPEEKIIETPNKSKKGK